MRRHIGLFDHFSLVAPIYELVIRPPDAEFLAELSNLRSANRLLDVGGGTGRVAVHLQGQSLETWVLDVSTGMLHQAVNKPGLVPCQGMAETLPFSDGSFDAIVVVDSFHHFAEHAQAARELVRVLAPGGRLVIEEPDVRRWSVKLVALGEKLALMRSHFFKPDALLQFFTLPSTTTTLHERPPNFWLVVEKTSEDLVSSQKFCT